MQRGLMRDDWNTRRQFVLFRLEKREAINAVYFLFRNEQLNSNIRQNKGSCRTTGFDF